MKRKGRTSKTNPEDEENAENGNVSDSDAPLEKRRKTPDKSFAEDSGSEEETTTENGTEEKSESEKKSERKAEKKAKKEKKSKKSKSKKNKAESDEENEKNDDAEDSEVDEKKSKKSKTKSPRKSKAESEEETEEKEDEDQDYEVEAVIDEKKVKNVRHYLIRWKGYGPESDTWEPENTLDCDDLIAKYKASGSKGASGGKKKDRKSKEKKEAEKWDENEDFEVDRIIEVAFKRDGKREFLVSWKGYPSTENTWEPEENMSCHDLIEKFMDKVEKAKQSTEKELRVNRKHTDRYTLASQSRERRLSRRGEGKPRVHYHDAE